MQIQTERGLINVVAEYTTEEMALENGFYYAWYSIQLGVKVYTKVLDDLGRIRNFAIVR